MPFKTTEKKRQYARDYKRKLRANPKYREEENKYKRLLYAKHRNEMRKYHVNRHKRIMQELREKLGNVCAVGKILNENCYTMRKDGKYSRLDVHNKMGENHPREASYYAAHVLNSEEIHNYVLLCRRHHKIVEFCLNELGMSWDEFEDRLKAFNLNPFKVSSNLHKV